MLNTTLNKLEYICFCNKSLTLKLVTLWYAHN